jgi:hypothetical protein
MRYTFCQRLGFQLFPPSRIALSEVLNEIFFETRFVILDLSFVEILVNPRPYGKI